MMYKIDDYILYYLILYYIILSKEVGKQYFRVTDN